MNQTQNQQFSLEEEKENKEEHQKKETGKEVNDVLNELDSELFSLTETIQPADKISPKEATSHEPYNQPESSDQKYTIVLSILHEMRDKIRAAIEVLEGAGVTSRSATHEYSSHTSTPQTANVVECVFNGQHMIGPDGKEYTVPANYASKSKLVEGDGLKLTITAEGRFIYKQIKPIERKRIVGTLVYNHESHQYRVAFEGKEWHVLTASATYYKGEEGDEVVLLVPAVGESSWGAVENIMKKEVMGMGHAAGSTE